MAKTSAPLPSDANDDLNKLIGAPKSADELQKVYLKSEEYSKAYLESLAKNATSSIDDLSSKSETLLKSVFENIGKHAENTAKGIKEDFKESYEGMAKGAEQATDKVVKQHKKQQAATKETTKQYEQLKKTGISGAIDSVVSNSLGRGLAEAVSLSSIAGELKTVLIGMAPALAAIGSVSAAIGFFLTRLTYWSDAMGKFEQVAGGSLAYFGDIQKSIIDIRKETNLDEVSIQQLALAYYGLGGAISTTDTESKGYLATGARMINFFGTSVTDVAKFERAMQDMGLTAGQADQTIQMLYQQMQEGHLTLDDFNASITEGYNAWRSFGNLTARTLDRFTSDMLGARNLFKGFNVDAT